MPSLAFVLAAAAAAGFVDAMVGGGGLIQLPALLTAYAREMPATLLGTNKLSSVLGTSSALARYARSVSIPWRMLLPAVLVAVPGALLGASLASVLPARAFRALVPLILTAVLLYVLRNRGLGTRHAPVALRGPRRAAALGAIGLVAAYDGFFGPGTGNFLMLLYVRVYGFDFLNAAASARVVNAATNLGALLYFGTHDQVRWPLALALGACNVAGSIAGAHTALRHGSRFVRIAFVIAVGALIARTAWNAVLSFL